MARHYIAVKRRGGWQRNCHKCGILQREDIYTWTDGDVWCQNCGGPAEIAVLVIHDHIEDPQRG